MNSSELDAPDRIGEIRDLLKRKKFLNRFYRDVYFRYKQVIESTPAGGIILELGSGGGFSKDVIPEIITSDVIKYSDVDRIVDATALPFDDCSIRTIVMMNVFHHIPNVGAFLHECSRCLIPGGKVLIVDQNMGWISTPILIYTHHESCDPNTKEWSFQSAGPLSSANGALTWIVFRRDFNIFKTEYPMLRMNYYRPNSAISYWIGGGLKRWSLAFGAMYPLISFFDKILCFLNPNFGSFVDVELERLPSRSFDDGRKSNSN